jgi:hypothetical protein
MNKTLIVMGNGPSLKNIDFSLLEGFDTFGLNAAYRAYEKMNWYPTYHGCFDHIVTDSHEQNFIRLINSGKIQKHFYIHNISDATNFVHINLQTFGSTTKINTSPEDFSCFTDNGNSGANACSVGICLGYKKIILIGVDCNYLEYISGAVPYKGGLKIANTPEQNPNYWFDDYQQKGDEYNIPRGQQFHKPTWEIFAKRASSIGVEVINCSLISKLDCFKKMTIQEGLGLK